MSKDLQIAHACPHVIRYERAFLDNGKFITTSSQILGDTLLTLRRDGVELPADGLFREASVTAPLKGPYRIKTGKSDLSIRLQDGTLYEVSIPPKIYSVKVLVDFLSGKFGQVTVEEENLALKFTDNQRGVGFTLFGGAMESLGFTLTKVRAKAKRIAPPWKLRKEPYGGYLLAFEEPLEPEGLLDISYSTSKTQCRRCNATGVENDFRLNADGDLAQVAGYDLLYQIIAKSLLTVQGSNPYHPWYGSSAMKLIGKKVSSALPSLLRQSVKETLDKMQSLQREQMKIQGVSNEERILSLENVSVERIGNDETAVLCTVSVRAASGKPVSINIIFAVPGSIPLDGDLK